MLEKEGVKMMEIRTVAILGAGAIGAYFINGMHGMLGENLWVAAEGARKVRLEKEGVYVNGKRMPLNLKTPDEAHGADLLIISVKYGALKDSLEAVERIIDSHTLVMAVLNGVDSEEIVASRIGPDRVIPSFMNSSAQRRGNEVIVNPGAENGVVFGEVDGSRTDRIEALDALFGSTEMPYLISSNIMSDMWHKYVMNVSFNVPQAIINCCLAAFWNSEHMDYLNKKMDEEVRAIAAAKGIDLKASTIGYATQAPKARLTTLQDLDAKRPTEIDMLSGTVVRMGRELGIPTPFNDFAYHAVKALEEKNSGLIS